LGPRSDERVARVARRRSLSWRQPAIACNRGRRVVDSTSRGRQEGRAIEQELACREPGPMRVRSRRSRQGGSQGMSDDGRMTLEDLEMVGEYLDGQGMNRGDLLKWGTAIGLGAAGMSAVAGKAGAAVSAGAALELEKTYGWMIAANVPFFEQTM